MELIGEAFVSNLEFSSVIPTMVSLEGRNRRTSEDLDSSGNQMLASFSGTLFDWSQAWELMTSDSLPSFLSALLFCN